MVCYSAPEWFPSLYVSCKQKSSTKLALLYQGTAKIKLGGFGSTVASPLGRSPLLRSYCASQSAPLHPQKQDTPWSSVETRGAFIDYSSCWCRHTWCVGHFPYRNAPVGIIGERQSWCLSMGGHATAPSGGQDRNSVALNPFWEFAVHLGCTVKSVLVLLSRIPHWKVRIIQPVP